MNPLRTTRRFRLIAAQFTIGVGSVLEDLGGVVVEAGEALLPGQPASSAESRGFLPFAARLLQGRV